MNIVKILSIIDTRDVIEKDDKFVPVSGTGDKHECAACGRNHEVHAHVLIDDGTIKTVGTGCMLKQTFEDSDVKSIKGKVNAYKKLNILKAELSHLDSLIEKNKQLNEWAENTRPNDVMPDAKLSHKYFDKLYARTNVTKVDFGDVFIIKDGTFPEDITAIEWVIEVQNEFWKRRKSERGYTQPYIIKDKRDWIEKRIAKCLEIIG